MASASASFQSATKALEGMKDESPAKTPPMGMVQGRVVPREGTLFYAVDQKVRRSIRKQPKEGGMG